MHGHYVWSAELFSVHLSVFLIKCLFSTPPDNDIACQSMTQYTSSQSISRHSISWAQTHFTMLLFSHVVKPLHCSHRTMVLLRPSTNANLCYLKFDSWEKHCISATIYKYIYILPLIEIYIYILPLVETSLFVVKSATDNQLLHSAGAFAIVVNPCFREAR